MNKEQILEVLTKIFREVLENPDLELTPGLTADDVANWDSVSHILIVVEVERRFGIKFKAAEMEELKNVGELVELIEKRVSPAGN